MTVKSIEELLVASSRGEPLDTADRSRLHAALASSSLSRSARQAQDELNVELAHLRGHLHGLRVPAASEEDLRAAFRAHGLAQAPVLPSRRRGVGIAAVLAAGVMIGAIVTTVVVRFEQPQREDLQVFDHGTPAATTASYFPASDPALSFQPLPYGPEVSPGESYSVVRVRVPIMMLASDNTTAVQGTMEADVLLGVDGLASGIRFDGSTAVFASAALQQNGGVE